MVGCHIIIALSALLTMYSVDASAISKPPDIEDTNGLESVPLQQSFGPELPVQEKIVPVPRPFDYDSLPFVHYDYIPFGPQLPPQDKIVLLQQSFGPELPVQETSWLSSFKCGPNHPLPDGRPSQCNPTGPYPCCDPISGWCGKTSGHCACPECIDYTILDVAPKYGYDKPGFRKAPTSPCDDGEEYVESCDKCDDCCYPCQFNTTTCACDPSFCPCIEKGVIRSAPRCNHYATPFVPHCDTCATCPVNECQTFNRKKCLCDPKFSLSCRTRAAKLRACAIPDAEYVEKCGTCAVCSDKCDWFNPRTCMCQRATSWEGCAK